MQMLEFRSNRKPDLHGYFFYLAVRQSVNLGKGNSEGGFDALGLEFAVNAEKYAEVAETCCNRILLTGSKELDGIYYKSDRVINGKATYATR